MPELELISSSTLKELADTGAVHDAVIVPASDGFFITVKCGQEQQAAQRVVQARRGHVRRFKTIDAAAKALRGFGLLRAELDLSRLEPDDISSAKVPVPL
ncbi:hypothetical protein AWV79_35570 [Cupriavidus sp. UYMMa02A]|nr:hypothetical protein AWV79_35570 [Cupriavidus sp. UYMMa02A]